MKIIIYSILGLLLMSFTVRHVVMLTCTDDNVFTGYISTDWDNSNNWTADCVPDGTITGVIRISSDCVVSNTNATDFQFAAGSVLIIDEGITFENNGTGAWTFDEISGDGTYCGAQTINGTLSPGSDCDEGLHPAFADFNSEHMTIYASGTNVVIQTNGLPDHTSPYWSNTTERCLNGPMGNTLCTNSNTTVDHALFVAPTVTTFDDMAPGNIDDFNGSYSLTVSQDPQLANTTSATGLGAIGFAVSGSVIYNDEEGPNVPLDNAIGSLDYTAAHTGPQSYHYHLEPHAWSQDDNELIGIISDGFFIYGRKCESTGTYPTDLDASGGHVSSTQHCSEPYYHYHIQNELYLNEYYILFPGDYQGTPSNIQ